VLIDAGADNGVGRHVFFLSAVSHRVAQLSSSGESNLGAVCITPVCQCDPLRPQHQGTAYPRRNPKACRAPATMFNF
jgi:hypothetical protein